MPVQLPNFRPISFQEANPFMTGFQQGQNTFSQGMQNAYLPQNLQAALEMKRAQAQRQQAMANLPFGGQSLTGPAGQVLGLELLRRQYGEDSDQYKSAKQLFDLGNQSIQSRVDYQNALAQNPERFLSSTGKSIVEENNVKRGLQPGGQQWSGNQISPQGEGILDIPNPRSQMMTQGAGPAPNSDLANQYGLLRQKGSTDTDTRKRNLFATNIEKTLEQINPDHLTQYSGLRGGLQKIANASAASLGKESKNYDNYQRSLVAANTLAKQVRQFYGDSIQPSMEEKLADLTNPSSWNSNPRLAKQNFNSFRTILKKEMQTYREALKTPEAYQSKGSENNDPLGWGI